MRLWLVFEEDAMQNWPITALSYVIPVNLYLCNKLFLLPFNDTEFNFWFPCFVFLVDQSLSSLLDHLRINSSTDIGSMIISEAGQGNLDKLKKLLHTHPDKVWYTANCTVHTGHGKLGKLQNFIISFVWVMQSHRKPCMHFLRKKGKNIKSWKSKKQIKKKNKTTETLAQHAFYVS